MIRSKFDYESYVDDIIDQMNEGKNSLAHAIGKMVKHNARKRIRKLSGEGEGSIHYRVEGGKVMIGSNLFRLIWLEFGTRSARAYRFLRPAATSSIRAIRQIAPEHFKFRSKKRRKWKK